MLDLLIDLDNTIYAESEKIFSQVDLRMKKFISNKLEVDSKKAFLIQKKYFKENGTTLRGLMIHHNIKPEPFLSYVHDIDLTSIKKNLKLKKLLKKYKGKKIIFTNGTLKHAKNVLKKIDVHEYIDDIFDIEDANYIPKPQKDSYLKVLKKFNLEPSNTVMIDDIPSNLNTAYKIGIKTILIKKNNKEIYNYIDHVNYDISNVISKLINKEIFYEIKKI